MRRDSRTLRVPKDGKEQEAQTSNCTGYAFVRAYLMGAVPGRAIEKHCGNDARHDEHARSRQGHLHEG